MTFKDFLWKFKPPLNDGQIDEIVKEHEKALTEEVEKARAGKATGE